MGHISEKGLCLMHSKGMVEGIHDCSTKFDFCEHCIYGKQNHVSFPSKATRQKGILELVHNDVFGLVSVPSLGGSRSSMSFINELSGINGYTFRRRI